mgnify:CR=1 FL=1
MDDLAIIIATRNRVDKLSKLLESINLLAQKPGQVIIVYSGDEVSSATDIFKYSINLTTNKSFIENQIEQKLGMKPKPPPKLEFIEFISEEEVKKLLIRCKDRFSGSELHDYTSDETVIEYFFAPKT